MFSLLLKDLISDFIFNFTAAGVVPCGGRKTSPRTSTKIPSVLILKYFHKHALPYYLLYVHLFSMQISIVKKTRQCMLLIVLLHMIHTVTYVTFSVRISIPDNLWSVRETKPS